MNTRRKFLLQGGMATTALLAIKPFNTLANITAPISGFNNNTNSILFLHTSAANTVNNAQHIAALKNSYTNVMLLHAGNDIPQHLQPLRYDASMDTATDLLTAKNYKIVHKGDVKTGIINMDSNTVNAVNELNTLAAYLKKEKGCNIVICLSSLGYRNEDTVDDRSLAAQSSDIDMIIGGHKNNFSENAIIALNKNNEEVIIDHAAKTDVQVGKISIGFNAKGQKRNITI